MSVPSRKVSSSVSFTHALTWTEVAELLSSGDYEVTDLYHVVGTFSGGYALQGESLDEARASLIDRYRRAMIHIRTDRLALGASVTADPTQFKYEQELDRVEADLDSIGVRVYGAKLHGRAASFTTLKLLGDVALIVGEVDGRVPDPIRF